MNLYEQQSWITPPSSTENKNASYFSEYATSNGTSNAVPLPHEDFTSYQQNYDQVDDFLTQTLSSLQELDIPVGESSSSNAAFNNQNQYNSGNTTTGAVRGHKKQPSGTAIFGFASHNRTLSIPGLPQAMKPGAKPNEYLGIAPGQIYSQAHQQQPILYQKPQDMEAASNRIVNNNRHSYQQFQPIPIPAPQTYHIPPQPQPPSQLPQVQNEKVEDFVITNKAPTNYKFPPDQPRAPAPSQQGQTVAVPVEYLQRITNYIKSREGIDMNKFLDYGYHEYPNVPNPQVMKRPDSPNPPVDISPVLKQMEAQRGQQPRTSDSTEVNTPVQTPEEQPIPPQSEPHSFQPKPFQTSESQAQPNPIGLGIRFEHNAKKDFESSESEFSEVPKTPSPILRSQAKFSSEQHVNNKRGLNWTPVIIGGDKSLRMLKRKAQDKVSTLPPGEIDQYIIGPSDDKTYVCNFEGCGKLFTRRYNVRSHVQTHLSDRPYICDVDGCNKAFVRQHDLTRHKKIHEDFEFKCPCGKGFSRHDALYRHRIRMICAGGIKESDDENKLVDSDHSSVGIKNGPNSSIRKSKKKNNKPIKIENDQVAKKLEFDLLNQSKNKTLSPSSSISSPIADNSDPAFQDYERDNVFLEQSEHHQKKPVSLDINSSQTPVDESPTGENMFLNDLNFGFDENSYDDYKF